MADKGELEVEFKKVVETVGAQIQEKIKEAEAALNAAVKLSEESGVPFEAGVSPLSQAYIPGSFEAKFGDLDNETVTEATGVWELSNGEGWEHSAVCW